ncbi:hypothetical protein G7Y89_g5312 [Cudoniella acicularis]|uniref:DUF7728 domain-containing protein n=1 Tax=Cudoniella acicularis TaxID=354080 RepID=A0A8H4RPZ1_9HELO|nr:hypothetical protein G7Y89_g5312 [Cudoniella acicularis]
MHFSHLAVAATVATLGNAILLPPTISSADTDIVNTLPFEHTAAIDGREMIIDCPGCPVAVKDVQGNVHFANVESVLRLNFSVAHGDRDRLMLNGLQLYPVDPKSPSFMGPLVADQLVKLPGSKLAFASEPKLGYSLSVKHPVHSKEDQLDLVAIHIEIVEVANKFIDGIPSIDLKLVETPSFKLMLGDAEISASKSTTSTPNDGNQECTTMVCKWRAIIADKLSKLKGCASKARPAAAVENPKHHGHHGRPHRRPHGGPNRLFRHHRHRHSIGRFFRNIAVHVLVPIFIGIAVGITASLIGMVVGNAVVFIWRALFRRNTVQYTKIQPEEEVVAIDDADESKGFLAHQGPPPTYTDATVTDEKTSE